MVDNRSAGFYGVGGAFNFKSGDPSGTAAKMSQEKYGSEAMYMAPVDQEDDGTFYEQPFVDRSALLRATLNSLAMSNVASVLNSQKRKKTKKEILDEIDKEDESEVKSEEELLDLEIKKIQEEAEKEFEDNL